MGVSAALAPIYWLGHNWWETSNALDFYNGPYSAAAIQGDKSYPGYHDWPAAIHYYWEAGRDCSGERVVAGGADWIAGCRLARSMASSYFSFINTFVLRVEHSQFKAAYLLARALAARVLQQPLWRGSRVAGGFGGGCRGALNSAEVAGPCLVGSANSYLVVGSEAWY